MVLGVDSGYMSHVECSGETGENPDKIIVFANQIEKIDDIKIGYYKKNGQLKNIRRLSITDLSISQGFYSDGRLYYFYPPENKQFKYEYDKKSEELFYSSSFRFGFSEADTEILIIKVPLDLHLRDEISDTSLMSLFEKKVTKYADYTEYFYKGVYKMKYSKTTRSSSRLKAFPSPFPAIRYIITPLDFIDKEEAYFNDFLVKLVSPSEQMSPETTAIIEHAVGNINDHDSIIEVLYDMVKSKIRYIDIEIGIGGYQPHKVDYILEKKQGDCKDMANLLCQSLRRFGLDANLAVSSTLGHSFNMDFPSMSSGNHMICVTKDQQGNYLFLDATETEGYYLNPSRQIQGTDVFVFGEGKGFFLQVPFVKGENNKTLIRYDLSVIDNKLAGKYNIEFNAISSLRVKTWYNETSLSAFSESLRAYLELISPRIKYLNYKVDSETDKITISGSVEIPKTGYTIAGGNNYLLLNFLPFPYNFSDVIEDSTAYIIYSTLDTQMDLYLTTQNSIQEVNYTSTKMLETPLEFELEASSEGHVLHVGYHYAFENIIIEKNVIHQFIQFDKKIKETFNKAVVFK